LDKGVERELLEEDEISKVHIFAEQQLGFL
jgi:hypothetical protein